MSFPQEIGWSDAKVLFELADEEIQFIESMIRPME